MSDVSSEPSDSDATDVSSGDDSASPRNPPSLWLSYMRLLRLPNVFTAMADVLLGAFLVQDGDFPWLACALLLLSSACLYTSGMVLNDVYDIEI
ncbi:MAG TPA: hypothetical protein VGE52_18845, partial [Pirellulales bacterium]